MKMDKNLLVLSIILLLLGIVGVIALSPLDCSDGKMECIVGMGFGWAFTIIFFGGSVILLLSEGIKYYIDRRQRY